MNSKYAVFTRFAEAGTEQLEVLREELRKGGYSIFSELLEGLRQTLMTADEPQMAKLSALVEKGRELLPNPGTLSPSWERIWDDYDRYIFHKQEALNVVSPAEREGEWQIVMDNPFTNEAISCYPGLSFLEAAYLYAYFRKDLKKNEYLRLQKIANLLMVQGD